MRQLIEKYLKGLTGSKPHLRLLSIVELYDNKDLTNCFGVFVGCKGSSTGDTEFPIATLIFDGVTDKKPKWVSEIPLWVVPLTKSGELYDLNYLVEKFEDSYNCERAVIKIYNKYKQINPKITNWKDYCFIPKDDVFQELTLPCTSFKLDIKLGSFHTISEKLTTASESTNIKLWISDKQSFTTNPNKDSLLTFEGITNEIISEKISNKVYYPEFTGFFGIGKRKDGFFWPVFSTGLKGNLSGFDVPIRWTNNGWLDDLLHFNIESNFKLTSVNDFDDDTDTISNRIAKKDLNEPTSWLCRIENDSNISFFIADKKSITGNLKRILSATNQSDLNTYLFYLFEKVENSAKEEKISENRTIICNITNTSNLKTSWNENTSDQAKAILKDKGSQPIGIVPKIDNLTLSSLTIKYEKVSGNNANFKKVYLPQGVLKAKISFPLIQNNKFKTLRNRIEIIDKLPSETEKPLIESLSIILKNSENGSVLDNGSILLLNVLIPEDTDFLKEKILLDGSFSFKLNGYKKDEEIIDKLQISLQLQNAQRPLFLWQWHNKIDEEDYIQFCYSINKFRIPVKEVNAFGNDLLGKEKLLAPSSIGAISEGFGERTEPTLVIPLKGKSTTIQIEGAEKLLTKYFLNLSESSNVAQDYRLEMQLEEKNQEGGKDNTTKLEAIVLNATPQQVAKIQTDFLRSPAIDDGVYILARKSNFSIDSGTWEIYTDKALEEGFQLTLPAQAIGEAYVKSNQNNEGEPKQNEPIDFRFSPPTVLQIANELLDRHYVTPAWNLKNIWGEVGNSSPGLQLIKAQFEHLYGLRAELENKEAFISELSLKLGTITNPPQNNIVWEASEDQLKSFENLYNDYRKLYRVWQSRLSILEVSNSDNSNKFTEGISYFIRRENKIDEDGKLIKIGAKIKWPIGGQKSPSKIDEDYHDAEGLAGGAFYPFESLGVYEELWREGIKKGSSSGEVEDLAFTSLGGYGKQTARFSGDKTIIKSTTSLGRTHFHAVERLGRIGVFWNKAKHVIEYERTVVPSIQFKGEQPDLLGRPLVRKVREYIEILEPIRHFPDLDSSYQQSAGSIIGCQFKSIKIPVSSSWGRNVINKPGEIIGWEIPLWNKYANQEIYPFPQVLLELLATKTSGLENVLTQIENVQDIYFYTDVRSEIIYKDVTTGAIIKSITIDANTDNWPVVKYIDYTDLPMVDLNKGTKPALGNTPELMDAILPAPIIVLPGFERFSFKVKPSEVTSSVNGRYIENSEINGKLRVVSMMRSFSDGKFSEAKPSTTLQGNSDLETVLNNIAFKDGNILNGFTNGFQDTNTKLISGTIPNNVNDFVAEIFAKTSSLGGQIEEIRSGLCKDPKLKYLIMNPNPTLEREPIWIVADNFELPTKFLWKKTIESADSFIGNILVNFDLLTEEAYTLIYKKILEVNDFSDAAIKLLYDEIESQILSIKKIIEQFSFELNSIANEAIELISSGTDIIRSFLSEVDKTLSDAKKEIKKINLLTTILDAKEKVKGIIEAVKAPLSRTINENNILSKLSTTFEIEKQISELVEALKDKIDSAALADINEMIEFSQQQIDELQNEIISLINDVKNISDEIQNIIDEESTIIKDAISDFEKELRNELKVVSNFISSAELQTVFDNISHEKSKFIDEFNTRWVSFIGKIKTNLHDSLISNFLKILVNTDDPLNSLCNYFKIIDGYIKGVIKGLSSFFNSLLPDLTSPPNPLDAYEKEFTKYLGHYNSYKKLEEAISTGDPKQILEQANQFAEEINEDLGNLTGDLLNTYVQGKKVDETYHDLNDTINNTLFNYRSVYDELIAPGLGFNRRTVSMIVNTDWKNVEQRLTISPVITKFNQLNENLSALGIRLPSVAITDKFLAPAKEWGQDALTYFNESFLNKFDFTNILKGAGGINLERLIPGFKMPDELRNNIKITHGTDKQNLKAWAKAESNITIPERKQLFAIGPVNVSLDQKATLIGNVKAEIDADSKLTKENFGELKGSFVIGLQSTELMRFNDVKVTCVNDKYSFDLDPSRMEMSGLLKLISDATKKLPAESEEEGEDTSVFKVAILKEKYNNTDIELPYGVTASLDIPTITVGGGPTNITNLAFGGNFKMKAFDIKQKKLDFSLGLGFYAGKREAPFVFTAFIFGGGGFIDCSLDYSPSLSSSLSVEFAMSVQASAALAFNGGWIYGSVMVGLGIEVLYIKKAYGPGSSTSVIMFVQFIGHVCVVSIIHVFLVVRLAIAYDGEKMQGTGRIKASMRICRFFTLKVEKDYTKEF